MMKKIFLIGSALLSFSLLNAQNELDALRVSQNFYGGTARFQSMGGAFGALGGDFSSLTTNPAGLGVYRSSELVFTPSLMKNVTESSYLDSNSEDFEYNFNLNNFGYVGHIDLNSSGWKGFNFGFGFNRLNNFHQNTIIQTQSANGSLLDEFILTSNGDVPINPSYYYEGMALAAEGIYLYDPATGDTYVGQYDAETNPGGITEEEINTIPLYTDLQYMNDFNYYAITDDNDLVYGQFLRKTLFNQGKLSEFVISGAANYNHQLYIGATVGIQRYRFENTVLHRESTSGSAFQTIYDPTERLYFESFDFEENNITWGTGVNFKFGLIYKPINILRIGAAIHTPTVQRMESEFSTNMETFYYDGSSVSSRSDLAVNEYRIYTPFKALGSIGLQIKKIALLSLDYEYVDYSGMRFKADGEDFSDLNNGLSTTFKAAHNIRAGAEVRLGVFALRGGIAYYDNPYTSESGNKMSTMLYSGGAGLNYKAVKFDVGYVMSTSEYDTAPYISSELASINSNTNKFIATVAFRF